MNFSLLRKVSLCGVLMLAPLVSGCRGTRDSYDETAKLAAEQIKLGKQYLSNQQYFNAIEAFDHVIQEIDASNNEARYGKVIAELLQFSTIVRLVSQVAGIGAEGDENDFIRILVRDFLADMTDRFENIAFELSVLKADPYATITLPDTPVFLTASNEPSLNLQGEWDRSELFLLDLPVQGLLGVFKLVNSIDLDADFLGIYNRFVDMGIEFDGAPEADFDNKPDTDTFEETVYNAIEMVEKPFDKLQNLIAWVLIKNPHLAGIRPDGGLQLRQEAGGHLASAIDNLQKFLFFTSYDAQFDLDQTDDVIAWGEKPKIYNAWDVPAAIDPDKDLCAIRDRADETELGDAEYTVSLRLIGPNDTLSTSASTGCLFEKLKESLNNEGTRISLTKDILPFIIGIISNLDGVDFSPQILESTITSITNDFIGDSFEFDFGPLFANPRGFRTFLPAWDDPSVEPDENNWLLALESECVWDPATDRYADNRTVYENGFAAVTAAEAHSPAIQYYQNRVINRIFCRSKPGLQRSIMLPLAYSCPDPTDKKDLCDLQHFPGSLTQDEISSLRLDGMAISRLPEDGVTAVLPYMYFQDPTFNGLLWIDVNGVATLDENSLLLQIDPQPGFSLATNATLNALIARISNNVDDIIVLLGRL